MLCALGPFVPVVLKHSSGRVDPWPTQTIVELVKMVAQLATLYWEQAVVQQQQLDQLQDAPLDGRRWPLGRGVAVACWGVVSVATPFAVWGGPGGPAGAHPVKTRAIISGEIRLCRGIGPSPTPGASTMWRLGDAKGRASAAGYDCSRAVCGGTSSRHHRVGLLLPAGLDITVMRSEDHLLAKRVWEAAATGSGKSTGPYYSNAAPGPMTTMACCCRAAPTSIE